MLYYKSDQWNFCPYLADYKDKGIQKQKYTESKQWWQDFAAKWGHITELSFTDVTPTSEQQSRLDAVNNEGIPEGFKAGACEYVETGALPTDEEGNVLPQFSNLSGDIIEPLSLSVSTDKDIITADGMDSVQVTIQIKRGDSLSSDGDGTWYVPVLGLDGVQHDLLKFVLSGGEATASWGTDRKGIYTVRMDLIRPRTSLKARNIEVIAE